MRSKAEKEANYAGPILGDFSDELAPGGDNPELESMVEKAKSMAKKYHANQRRWSGALYETHPECVSKKFHQTAYYYRAVAWLHDAVEDTSLTIEEVYKEFPAIVADALAAINHDKSKAQSYLDYLLTVKENEIALAVKLADIEHNLGDLSNGNLRDKYVMAKYILDK